MAKKIRFPLEMENGIEVRSVEELKKHFSLAQVIMYASNGKLITWLKDRYADDIAEAMESLDSSDVEYSKKICAIFDVPYDDTIQDDLEQKKEKSRKLNLLRQYTVEQRYVDVIDAVAFEQDDIYDLLDEGATTIYLCGEEFSIPIAKKGINYIGINNPVVFINSKIVIDWKEKEISLSGIRYDEKYQSIVNELNLTQSKMNSEVNPYNLYYFKYKHLETYGDYQYDVYGVSQEGKKQVLYTTKSHKNEMSNDRSIAALAKAPNELWILQENAHKGYELIKTDNFGKNAETVKFIPLDTSDRETPHLWANSSNVYIQIYNSGTGCEGPDADSELFQLDSNNNLCSLMKCKINFDLSKITNEYFMMVPYNWGGMNKKIIIWENDIQLSKEYVFPIETESTSMRGSFDLQKISSWGIYKGLPTAVVYDCCWEILNSKHFVNPKIYQIDIVKNQWNCITTINSKGYYDYKNPPYVAMDIGNKIQAILQTNDGLLCLSGCSYNDDKKLELSLINEQGNVEKSIAALDLELSGFAMHLQIITSKDNISYFTLGNIGIGDDDKPLQSLNLSTKQISNIEQDIYWTVATYCN